MKKTLYSLLAVSFIGLGQISAQNDLGNADDASRISITPFVDASRIDNMPSSAVRMLENKMKQMCTKSGLSGDATSPRFIITSNVTVTGKEMTTTAPPMVALNLEATFFVADAIEKVVFSSASVSLKGVGNNETKAYIQALKGIRSNNPQIMGMMNKGKGKIIEYYNSNCDRILADAQAFADQQQYKKAIHSLSGVPSVCQDCYMKAREKVKPIYMKQIELDCKKNLDAANSAWAGAQDKSGADKAAALLSKINPEAECYEAANELVESISKKMAELEQRDWDFKMKQYEDEQEKEKAMIKATTEIAKEVAKELPPADPDTDFMW